MPDNIIFLYFGMLLFNINIIEASKLRIIGADGMHVCPGSTLTLECTVDGGRGGSTVWEGTALGDCEIILLHHRFRRPTGTFGMCNNGAIIGRSVSKVESNITSLRSYISQLEMAITADMIRTSIECTHDDGAVHTIGRYRINIVSTWPLHIQFDSESTASLTSSNQILSFSWAPAISDCPDVDIHYYILSANCGTCPIATADTSITCSNVPSSSCSVCILVVQTAVNGYTVKDLLSNPVYVYLNQIRTARNCTPIDSNSSEIDTGSDVNSINSMKIGFTTFMTVIASTAILAIALTVCFTTIIAALVIKKKLRSFKSLLLHRTNAERYQAAEIRAYEPVTQHSKADCETLENAVYVTNSTTVSCSLQPA